MPAGAVPIVEWERVMIIVVTFSHRQQSDDPAVSRRITFGIGLRSELVHERVDRERQMVGYEQPQGAAEQEPTPRVAHGPTDQRRQGESRACTDENGVPMLPTQQWVTLEIRHGYAFLGLVEALQHPTHVRVPKTALRVVRVG